MKKKILSIISAGVIIVFAVLFGVFTVFAEGMSAGAVKSADKSDIETEIIIVTEPEEAKGDVNGDGEINVTDCVRILMYVNGKLDLSEQQLAKADIDGNGSIEKTDAEALAKHISAQNKTSGNIDPDNPDYSDDDFFG